MNETRSIHRNCHNHGRFSTTSATKHRPPADFAVNKFRNQEQLKPGQSLFGIAVQKPVIPDSPESFG